MKLKNLYLAALAFVNAALRCRRRAWRNHPRRPRRADTAAGVHSKTLWEQIKEGGWVMIPIGLCSVATLYLIGDGIIRTSRKRSRRRRTSRA